MNKDDDNELAALAQALASTADFDGHDMLRTTIMLHLIGGNLTELRRIRSRLREEQRKAMRSSGGTMDYGAFARLSWLSQCVYTLDPNGEQS